MSRHCSLEHHSIFILCGKIVTINRNPFIMSSIGTTTLVQRLQIHNAVFNPTKARFIRKCAAVSYTKIVYFFLHIINELEAARPEVNPKTLIGFFMIMKRSIWIAVARINGKRLARRNGRIMKTDNIFFAMRA